MNLLQANPSKYQIIAIDPKFFIKELVDKLLLQIDNQVVKSFDKTLEHWTLLIDACKHGNVSMNITLRPRGHDIQKNSTLQNNKDL